MAASHSCAPQDLDSEMQNPSQKDPSPHCKPESTCHEPMLPPQSLKHISSTPFSLRVYVYIYIHFKYLDIYIYSIYMYIYILYIHVYIYIYSCIHLSIYMYMYVHARKIQTPHTRYACTRLCPTFWDLYWALVFWKLPYTIYYIRTILGPVICGNSHTESTQHHSYDR